jgi:SpoVK/Ycf46/Vps4 family AAA+-type ATPase
MSVITVDPIEKLLNAAETGKSLIKNRDVLHFTYIPNTILHRDNEQEQVTQSLIPILKQSRPSNLLVYGKPGTGKTLVVRKVSIKPSSIWETWNWQNPSSSQSLIKNSRKGRKKQFPNSTSLYKF